MRGGARLQLSDGPRALQCDAEGVTDREPGRWKPRLSSRGSWHSSHASLPSSSAAHAQGPALRVSEVTTRRGFPHRTLAQHRPSRARDSRWPCVGGPSQVTRTALGPGPQGPCNMRPTVFRTWPRLHRGGPPGAPVPAGSQGGPTGSVWLGPGGVSVSRGVSGGPFPAKGHMRVPTSHRSASSSFQKRLHRACWPQGSWQPGHW